MFWFSKLVTHVNHLVQIYGLGFLRQTLSRVLVGQLTAKLGSGSGQNQLSVDVPWVRMPTDGIPRIFSARRLF